MSRPSARRAERHILHLHAGKGARMIHEHWAALPATGKQHAARGNQNNAAPAQSLHRKCDCSRNFSPLSNSLRA
jgi:hypothetical protein